MTTRRRLGLTLGAALLALTVSVQAVGYLTFEQIPVAGTAIGFTNAKIVAGSGHPQATHASCRLETAEIRFTYDGTTPTSTVGTLLEVGESIDLYGNDVLQAFRSIRTGSSGQLDCHYDGQ